jgi:hypothetical protein
MGERMRLLEEEVTQGRAEVDLYRIQMEESCEERDHLKVCWYVGMWGMLVCGVCGEWRVDGSRW